VAILFNLVKLHMFRYVVHHIAK